MALESKPLFHPEVIRQQVRAFNLPERVEDWQPKLQHWAGLIASGRANDRLPRHNLERKGGPGKRAWPVSCKPERQCRSPG